uniref:Uncharacterized protein n=1 Tax=Aegilops tauschii subsp. strangulata TaxID=200361 RepID=A0A453DF49_AEGTS
PISSPTQLRHRHAPISSPAPSRRRPAPISPRASAVPRRPIRCTTAVSLLSHDRSIHAHRRCSLSPTSHHLPESTSHRRANPARRVPSPPHPPPLTTAAAHQMEDPPSPPTTSTEVFKNSKLSSIFVV